MVIINCSNQFIGPAVPEVNSVSPKNVFIRYFGLNWQMECPNNFRFA